MPAKPIRPWRVFNLVTADSDDRIGCLFLPHRDSVMLSIETLVIVSLVKYLQPKRAFEFGTFLGETTLSIAANLPADGTVFTLDLGEQDVDGVSFNDFDEGLARVAVAQPPKFTGTALASKIQQIHSDSMKLQVAPAYGNMDFVLIDGNHDIEYVRSDTEKAFEMIGPEGCIVWHDYGPIAERMATRVGTSPAPFTAITEYVDGLADTKNIYYVEDTRLAIYSRRFSW